MRLFPAIALLFVASCTDSALFVTNDSDFEIHEMYVTDVRSSSWGPNLLDGEILFPGESLTLGLDCGTYDALLIDETDAICEVSNLDLCYENADWVIRNNSCAVFEARAAAAAKATGDIALPETAAQ
jgi:hypothetical protein